MVPSIEGIIKGTVADALRGKPKDRDRIFKLEGEFFGAHDIANGPGGPANAGGRVSDRDRELLDHYVSSKIAELRASGQSEPMNGPALGLAVSNEASGSETKLRNGDQRATTED